MQEKLALRVLGEIMSWDDARATSEFKWLSLMSRMKYDGYHDFLAGVRFLESLSKWLQQFRTPAERDCAYGFVRAVLVYIGPAEMLRLIEAFYPDHVQRRLLARVAQKCGIPAYLVWSQKITAESYDKLLRRTLFIGLSEGARLDLLRRANAGIISNEQVLLATYVERDKWDKVRKELRDDTRDPEAQFEMIYLIDDFVGSGTTFLRKDPESTGWKGKLPTFYNTVRDVLSSHFTADVIVCVHHYIATHRAKSVLAERSKQMAAEHHAWFRAVEFTYGTVLPESLPVNIAAGPEAKCFIELAERYFDEADPSVNNKHIEQGGTNAALGFSGGALPLVLEHNTPNNSVALLWAETEGAKPDHGSELRHAMRALFRRRHRHV